MKQQVLVIHGGTSFDSYEEYIEFIKTRDLTLDTLTKSVDWRFSLAQELGHEYEVLLPKMPNGTNARYEEWCIWFERCLSFVEDGVILIGHSLGGIFVAKYLSEHMVSCKIGTTILLAAPYDATSTVESLREFALPESLHGLVEQAGDIYLLHSKDDPVVPIGEAEKYQAVLSHARKITFENKRHCVDSVFPELVTLIRKI